MIYWPDNVPIINIIFDSYRFKNRDYYVTYTKNETIVIILLTRRVFFSNRFNDMFPIFLLVIFCIIFLNFFSPIPFIYNKLIRFKIRNNNLIKYKTEKFGVNSAHHVTQLGYLYNISTQEYICIII